MKIRKIRIDGFKNLHDTVIDFNGLNALVALNNYGKSNYFEAIDFANDIIQASDKSKLNIMQFQNAVPINNESADNDFIFEIEYETEIESILYLVNYLFSFEWIKQNNKGSRIVKETLKVKSENDKKTSTFINRTLSKKLYKSSKTGRCDKPIKIGDNALLINKLSNYDELYYSAIVEQINNFEFDFIDLDNVDRFFNPSGRTTVDSTGTMDTITVPSFSKYFYDLAKTNKKEYELLINSIQDLLPDIEYIKTVELDFRQKSLKSDLPSDIPFEIPEKIYDIRVKIRTNNQDTSINSLSDGSKRIFYIIASCILANATDTHLIAFEELENSIHPTLLQRLLVIISELTDETQILITSHSPHLIKYLDLDSIFLGIPNKKGLAYFKKVKKSKQNKLTQYAKDSESTIGEFIFDMLVEGFNDDSFWLDFI